MKITVDLTAEDLAALSLYVWRVQRERTRTSWLALAVGYLPVMALVGFFLESTPDFRPGVRTMLRVMLALLVVMYPLILWFDSERGKRWQFRRAFARRAAELPLRVEITLLPERVVVQDRTGTRSLDWGVIQRIDEDADYLFMCHGPMSGLVIPRRALPAQLTAESFLQAARGFQQSVRASGSEVRGPE